LDTNIDADKEICDTPHNNTRGDTKKSVTNEQHSPVLQTFDDIISKYIELGLDKEPITLADDFSIVEFPVGHNLFGCKAGFFVLNTQINDNKGNI